MSQQVASRADLPPLEWTAIEAACALNPIASRVETVFENSRNIGDHELAKEYRNAELLRQAREIYFDTTVGSDYHLPDELILTIFNGLSRNPDMIRAVAKLGAELHVAGINPKRALATIDYAAKMCQQTLGYTYQVETPELYDTLQSEHTRLTDEIEKISKQPV